jgi:hypothetical protein
MYIYIYIYIFISRERERESSREMHKEWQIRNVIIMGVRGLSLSSTCETSMSHLSLSDIHNHDALASCKDEIHASISH